MFVYIGLLINGSVEALTTTSILPHPVHQPRLTDKVKQIANDLGQLDASIMGAYTVGLVNGFTKEL